MKTNFIGITKILCCLLFTVATGLQLQAQKNNAARRITHPESFTITREAFDQIYTLNEGEKLDAPGCSQLHNAKALINVKNGDMQFVRLQLAGIPKAYLAVQVNGSWSTQVFVLSDDHSISYKGTIDERQVQFVKVDEDEIISE